MPPVLHRQAEDSRQRRPGRPLREALRQAQGRSGPGCSRQIAGFPTPELCNIRTGRASVRVWGKQAAVDAVGRCDMTQPVQTIGVLLGEHAELEKALSDPELHSKPEEARKVG